MELQVGMIANTRTYQENFDLGNEKVDLKQLAESFRPKQDKQAMFLQDSTDQARLNMNSSHQAIETIQEK